MYFITTACWKRRRLFQVERNAQLLLDTIVKNREHFGLHAFVIMPDHVHLLITPRDVALERVMQLIKGGFSHAYGQSSDAALGVWQSGFTDHRVRDGFDFETHVSYIHDNPVAARLVLRPEEYRWSSAANLLAMDAYLSG
jgi:putative transposase